MRFHALPVQNFEDITLDLEQLEAALTTAGALAPLTGSAWIAPTLINSWANAGGAAETAGYLKDPMGFVHLKGVVGGGTSGTQVFLLPVGYRAGATTQHVCVNGSIQVGVVQVSSIGPVTIFTPTATAVGLSGITFLAEH